MKTNAPRIEAIETSIEADNSAARTAQPDSPVAHLGRREFLRLAGQLSVAVPLVSAFVAACGDDDDDGTDGDTTGGDTDTGTETETGSTDTTGGPDTEDTNIGGDTETGTSTDTDTTGGTSDETDTGTDTDTDTATDTTGGEYPAPDDGGTETAFAPESISENVTLFAYGVQAGVPTQTTVILWGYTAGSTAARPLRVWRASETAGAVVLVKDLMPSPDAAGFFKLTVDGLSPGQTYFYAFFDGAAPSFTARSIIGRFRTAHADGVRLPVTIAATTCTNYKFRPYTSLTLAAKEDIDAFLQLGDMSYTDSPAAESSVKGAAVTEAEYAELWGITLQEPGYRAILARAGLYATLDDHEVVNNSKLYDNLPQARYDAAMNAYFRHVAVPHIDNTEDRFRFWNSYRWGDSVEFFVLDSRLGRKPDTRRGPDAIYLNKEQMVWLKAGLKASTAHFKVLLNSVPITDYSWSVSEEDRWEGYAAQRDELLDHIIGENIRNVWFLTGDFHFANVSRVDIDPKSPRRRIHEIMVGPGASNVNPLKVPYLTGDEKTKELLLPASQFDFLTFETSNTTILTFDPVKNTVRVKYVQAKTEEVLFDKELSENDA